MTDELLNALKLIKKECEKHTTPFDQHCRLCPLSDYGYDCGVYNYTPNNWSLEKREVYF